MFRPDAETNEDAVICPLRRGAGSAAALNGAQHIRQKPKPITNPIKSTNLIPTLLALVVTAALGLTAATAKDKDDPKLLAKAKITKVEAQKTALTKAPDGTVKDAELEEENGKLVWSFDIARPGTKDITEVQVDALTGKIVAVDVETPKDQAKEAQADKAEADKKEGKKKAAKE